MPHRTLGAVIATLGFVGVSCSTVTSPSAISQFTWSIDGQSFQAVGKGMNASRGGDNLFIVGANCQSSGVTITLSGNNTSPGTFHVGDTLSIGVGDGSANEWRAGGVFGGSGTLTILAIDQQRVSGTFSTEATRFLPARDPASKRSVQGSFDLAFGNQVIC